MRIGKYDFSNETHTYVCGILNITPDSFSDGGFFNTTEKALNQAGLMISQGADILDIGGESSRPGFTPISEEEEIDRLYPVVERIIREFDVPVSVDTWKHSVAQCMLELGADMINDIKGLRGDDFAEMAKVIAANHASVCIMHNREEEAYSSFYSDVIKDMERSLHIAEKAGIDRGRILVDPGVGFAKSQKQNLEIMGKLREFGLSLGVPVLLGASRKSVIGYVLNNEVNERLYGTLATTAVACETGCRFVRVHDVKPHVEFIKMWEAIHNQ